MTVGEVGERKDGFDVKFLETDYKHKDMREGFKNCSLVGGICHFRKPSKREADQFIGDVEFRTLAVLSPRSTIHCLILNKLLNF